MFYLCWPPKNVAVHTDGSTQIDIHIFLIFAKNQTSSYCDDKLIMKDSINMCTFIKRGMDLKKNAFRMVSMG